jgi:tetratricopeptide (TPR) repeat protein
MPVSTIRWAEALAVGKGFMIKSWGRWMMMSAAMTSVLTIPCLVRSQEFEVVHTLEGRLQHKNGAVGGIRVRLVRKDSLQPVGDTFSRTEGDFIFTRISDGDYLVETSETEIYEATSTEVILRPKPRRPTYLNVFIEIPAKTAEPAPPTGVVTADVDLHVPKAALKHYQAGAKALSSRDSARAESELRLAIEGYPDYYAARLDLGREFRQQKRYKEAEEVLNPLPQVAPRRAEPRLELGTVLLELNRRDEAVSQLRAALQLEETNWATHLYLGWALLETRPNEAEPHFKRALELNERKAARAHLALARIADTQGMRQIALKHLDAYISLMPNASDTEAARKLADKLRQ